MRHSLITLSLLGSLLLAGCPEKAPKATGGDPPPPADQQGTAAPGEAPADAGASAPPIDPAATVTVEVRNNEVISTHNGLGDRINLEQINPWPIAMGPNAWSFSFKPSETAPLDLMDHLTIEVSKVGAPADSRLSQSYAGGERGGTLQWTPDGPGDYLFRASVMRKGQPTGIVEYKLHLPGDAPATPDAPPADPAAPAEGAE